MPLVTGNYDSQRTFANVEWLAVAPIGQQNDAVTKSGIKFRQREKYAVTVRGTGEYAQGHVWPFQFFA